MSNNTSPVTLSSLVQFEHYNIALLFCNYLLSQNIPAKVESEEDAFVIYCDSQHRDQAKAIFEEFIKQPHHPKYQQAAWDNAEVSHLKDNSPSVLLQFKEQFFRHGGIVTLVVFALCWLVFILSELGWKQDIFNQIGFYYNFTMANFIDHPFRLIGPAFFHFTWLHIIFNTMWWWQIGGSIERVLGKGALINLFFISAIVSNVGQFMVSGPNFGGLSGVVYALFGYMWWYGWLAPEKGLTLSKPIVGILLFFMLLGFAEALPVNMANTAHLLGLISGCGLAWFNIKFIKN